MSISTIATDQALKTIFLPNVENENDERKKVYKIKQCTNDLDSLNTINMNLDLCPNNGIDRTGMDFVEAFPYIQILIKRRRKRKNTRRMENEEKIEKLPNENMLCKLNEY